MAATIKIKNSSTAGAAPTTGDLVQGELAVNVTDKRLYTENSGGTIVELGTNPSIPVTFPDGSASAPSLTNDGDTNTGIFFPAADTVGIATGGTERLRLDSAGNLGLGVTPSAWASFPAIQFVGGYSVSPGGFGQNTYYNAGFKNITTGGSTLYQPTGGAHIWYSGASGSAGSAITFTQAMTLDASGNLLVGTSSQLQGANSRLNVAGDFYNGNGVSLKTTNGGSGSQFIGFINESGTLIGSINRVTTTNAVAYNTTSDVRLKSNIEDAAPVLDKIMQVQVRQYDWTEGNLHQDYGFIAQELEPLLSGVVSKGRTEEDVWQLDYSKLTPHLLKAIQEQQAIITQLKADVAALKGQA